MQNPQKLFLLVLTLALFPAGAAFAQDQKQDQDMDLSFQEFHFAGTLGMEYSNGSYGTSRNTNVEIALPALSVETGNLKFSASMPYLRISGRGLVVFDAAGNAVVINRHTTAAPDVRTGWGDLNLSASYTIPGAVLDDFEVRVTGTTKIPTASDRRKLSTGKADFGLSIDVSRKFDIWGPFVTVGYLIPGAPDTFQLYDTTSVSAGTTIDLSESFIAVVSYDYDSASTPLVEASHEMFGSVSWVREDGFTLTGYATAGLSSGSPNVGGGLLLSYNFN